MLLRYKILIGAVIVVVLVAIGVTLGIVLTGDEELIYNDICKTSNSSRRSKNLLESDSVPFFLEKMRKGPPDLTINQNTRATPIYGWITQRVDHFNPNDLRTWEMRYLKNDEFYEDGAPIFIFLGGEWEIGPSYLMTGQLYDMAREHKGYMFYTEHRYYGESFPTSDLCTESMQYLNIDQALADVVYFIEHQKIEIPSLKDSKVVLVGCSYSATMATWMRIKYPHMIDAAFASSAPLLAIEDFYQYYDVVGNSIKLISPECANVLSEAMDEIVSTLSSNNNDGLNTISNDFRSCSPLNLAEPYRSYFFSGLISPFASLVQYAQSSSIQAVCNSILSNPGSSYEKFKQYFNSYYAGSCIGNYDGFIDYLDYPLPNGDYRQWMYQTCAEYGFYQTTSSNNTIFGKNTVIVDLYRKMCEDVYGITPEMLNSGIERTNFFYGGLKPSYTKVVSVHGTIDPWSSIGLTEDLNDDAPVFVVEGTSHCADISSESVYDIAQMRETKRKVKELIAKWITD